MLVPLHGLLASARRERWALGAFNTYNLEISAAIIAAAEAQEAPVIVQTGPGALRGLAGVALPALVLALAQAARVPVAVHLDHCSDIELIERCIRGGYTSVMVDGSALAFDENAALTARAVELGHRAGITVEAELTGMAGDEDNASAPSQRPAAFTDPVQAREFATATGVDLLAVAIGNVHGHYRGEPRLDFALLDELARVTPVPLVMHGASGLSDETLSRAIAAGICKINFNTELRAAYCSALAEALPAARAGQDVAAVMASSVRAVQSVVEQKLALLGASGRADRVAR